VRACFIAGIVLIWGSAFIIPLGTHFQTVHPKYAEYRNWVLEETKLNPAGRVGLMLGLDYAVVFASCFCCFTGLVFTGCVLGIRNLAWRGRSGLGLAASTFAVGCFVGRLLGLREAIESFSWGFESLGTGYLVSAVGLTFGAAGAVGLYLTKRRFR
jgi:hypothetical protein